MEYIEQREAIKSLWLKQITSIWIHQILVDMLRENEVTSKMSMQWVPIIITTLEYVKKTQDLKLQDT